MQSTMMLLFFPAGFNSDCCCWHLAGSRFHFSGPSLAGSLFLTSVLSSALGTGAGSPPAPAILQHGAYLAHCLPAWLSVSRTSCRDSTWKTCPSNTCDCWVIEIRLSGQILESVACCSRADLPSSPGCPGMLRKCWAHPSHHFSTGFKTMTVS